MKDKKKEFRIGDSRTNDPAWLDTLPRYTVITEADSHCLIPRIAQKTEDDKWCATPWEIIGCEYSYDSEVIGYNTVCTIIWLPETKHEN